MLAATALPAQAAAPLSSAALQRELADLEARAGGRLGVALLDSGSEQAATAASATKRQRQTETDSNSQLQQLQQLLQQVTEGGGGARSTLAVA